jgi:hypothetical protein
VTKFDEQIQNVGTAYVRDSGIVLNINKKCYECEYIQNLDKRPGKQ